MKKLIITWVFGFLSIYFLFAQNEVDAQIESNVIYGMHGGSLY